MYRHYLQVGQRAGYHVEGGAAAILKGAEQLEYTQLALPVWTLAGFISLGDANIPLQVWDGKGPEPLI